MNQPIKHHYVPQFYLRRWCDNNGKIAFFMRKNGEVFSSRVATDATAFENKLYSYEKVAPENRQVVERFFGEIVESNAAPVLEKLLQDGQINLSVAERRAWATFLIASRLRVPEMIKSIKKDATKELLRSLTEDHEEFVIKGGATIDTLPAWVERNMVGLVDNFGLMILPQIICDTEQVDFICGMHWWVENLSSASVPLMTSDRPLWISTELKKPTGLLALPLSPTHVFFAASNRQLQAALNQNGVSKLARRCNTSIVSQAARFVYGSAKPLFIKRHLAQ